MKISQSTVSPKWCPTQHTYPQKTKICSHLFQCILLHNQKLTVLCYSSCAAHTCWLRSQTWTWSSLTMSFIVYYDQYYLTKSRIAVELIAIGFSVFFSYRNFFHMSVAVPSNSVPFAPSQPKSPTDNQAVFLSVSSYKLAQFLCYFWFDSFMITFIQAFKPFPDISWFSWISISRSWVWGGEEV